MGKELVDIRFSGFPHRVLPGGASPAAGSSIPEAGPALTQLGTRAAPAELGGTLGNGGGSRTEL